MQPLPRAISAEAAGAGERQGSGSGVHASGGLRELPAADYALPVRGSGPPSLLLLDEVGALRVVGPDGVRSVRDHFTDGLSARLLDARLQAR